ncbi:MAG: outer membrane lipoprotein carrier protein LolA [Cryomorphaceae bacterium]
MKLYQIAATAVLAVITATSLDAQEAKAKGILDELSNKTRKYTSITSDFSFTLKDKIADVEQTQEGKLKMQGKKYVIVLGDNQIFSDGQTRWTYSEDMNEVYIDNAEGGEDVLNPTDLYTVWETGFKHYYDGETTHNGAAHHLIKLNPNKPDEKAFHTVKLFIDKSKMEVTKMEILGKQGDDYTYLVKTFKTETDYPSSAFVFDKAKFPGVEVIDNR